MSRYAPITPSPSKEYLEKLRLKREQTAQNTDLTDVESRITTNEGDITDLDSRVTVLEGAGGGGGAFTVLTNGDATTPELVFVDGDVINVPLV